MKQARAEADGHVHESSLLRELEESANELAMSKLRQTVTQEIREKEQFVCGGIYLQVKNKCSALDGAYGVAWCR